MNALKYQIYKDKSGKFRFRLLAGNKLVIGLSQIHASRETSRKGRNSVIRNAKSPVEEI